MAGIIRCLWDNRWVIDFDRDDFVIVMMILQATPGVDGRREALRELLAIGYDADKATKLCVKAAQENGYLESGMHPFGYEPINLDI